MTTRPVGPCLRVKDMVMEGSKQSGSNFSRVVGVTHHIQRDIKGSRCGTIAHSHIQNYPSSAISVHRATW